ncbi:hypothetical protein H4Q32_011510 [Labeo rohita]|uniref:Uncharacterized protein n=1 Tax=Labeo rohita TaxID=84645 RepID=A0ABQ8LVU0_LABRO|nr:hypothetical protein H4Q32_011510 [Labeo rohita]
MNRSTNLSPGLNGGNGIETGLGSCRTVWLTVGAPQMLCQPAPSIPPSSQLFSRSHSVSGLSTPECSLPKATLDAAYQYANENILCSTGCEDCVSNTPRIGLNNLVFGGKTELEGECEHCNLLPIKVLRARLTFFKDERAAAPSLQSWGSRVDLGEGLRTLSIWFSPRFLTLGPTLGPCCRRKMLTTDASLTGWGEWPSSPRDLERSSSQLAHQLPRNDGCISGPEILPPAVKRLPCPSAGGQHSGGLLHKSPGRTAVAPPEQASAADSALGTGQVPVSQSDLYSGAYEYGSRLSVQTSCDTRGMETPSRSRDSTMSPLLLSDSSSSPGSGRDGPYVAQTASVRISPDCSAPGSPSQSPSTGVSPLIDSAPLADQSMVLRSNIPPQRLAVGDSGQERSPISGTGDNISSPARALEPSCLAPEGDQQEMLGFQLMLVYVAAISACHTLIDGVSVRKHPLVVRFVRGARRLRLPTRATVPSWDLVIVLEENQGFAGSGNLSILLRLCPWAGESQGAASSTAIARGAPLQQVCDAAGWSSHLSDSTVWISMLLRARTSLSQHPRVMSETYSMFVRTHYTTLTVQTLPVRQRCGNEMLPGCGLNAALQACLDVLSDKGITCRCVRFTSVYNPQDVIMWPNGPPNSVMYFFIRDVISVGDAEEFSEASFLLDLNFPFQFSC